jgi:tight adherence protein C
VAAISDGLADLPWFTLGAAVLVGLALAGGVLAALRPRPAVTGVQRSLELIRDHTTGGAAVGLPLPPASARDRLAKPLLAWLVRIAVRITPIGTGPRLRRRLDLAGNPAGLDLEKVLACKATATLATGGLALAVVLAKRSTLALALAALLVALGYWITDILLYNAALHRQARLRAEAPDVIDMLTVCVEAGLGFDAALAQVSRNTRGPLASEIARLLQEMQLGRSRVEAFTDFGARTDVRELNNFVSALVQADRLGVPIAQVLREQSTEMRLRRRQRAEEQAQKIPVKIIFPVILCIFPALMVIVIGPGAIQIAEMFGAL